MAENANDKMEKIVSLAKRRGFVYPGSEIYGGLANTWDYGPLGVELKNNIKRLWWRTFVQLRDDMVGIDASILMSPRVWEASGHLKRFTDPLVECKKCHSRFRADQLVESSVKGDLNFKIVYKNFLAIGKVYLMSSASEINKAKSLISTGEIFEEKSLEKLTDEEKKNWENIIKEIAVEVDRKLDVAKEHTDKAGVILTELEKSQKYTGFVMQYYMDKHVPCPICESYQWTLPMDFNLMFKTFIGSSEEKANTVYLRPETAQAMFVDFKNVLNSSRKKIPFGIAQQGKAFRNEITPGNFIFRTLEFEQMEIEYFIREKDWEKTFEYWKDEMEKWIVNILGIKKENIRIFEHPKEDLSHYSKRTIDFEYNFPFGGFKELYGLAYRTNFDLTAHQKASGEDMNCFDEAAKEKFIPHVIEPTFGVDRSILAVLADGFEVVKGGRTTTTESAKEEEITLHLSPRIAPIKAAVLPLVKKEPLKKLAEQIYKDLREEWMVQYDETGSVGRRYRRQDEIGTPFCITVDFDSLEDNAVTVRDRDTMKQERIKIAELIDYLEEKLV